MNVIKRQYYIRVILVLTLLSICFSVFSQERVGLVLSGGGAKGIAHVGVIKALEENDIPIDYVAGTSMGAIVGGFYSCGYSPDEMMSLFTSSGFADWSSGMVNPKEKYYFSANRPSPELARVSVKLRNDSIKMISTNIYRGYVISPLPMNMEYLRLFAKYQLQCKSDFNKLFVPFRCVYSDVYNKHKVVCGNGSLPNSIRASMTFPLVFKPIEMNGVLAYDGGIYDNFPVNVMEEEFDPDFIIGVSVSLPDKKPLPDNAYSQIEDLIIQNNNYDLNPEKGVKIQIPVQNFAVLDFPKVKEIYEIGYKTGLAFVDSIKSRLSARRSADEVHRARMKFNAATPTVFFDSVQVTGATPRETDYISYQFRRGRNRPFGIAQTTDAYYHLISDDKISDLVPVCIPESSGNNILQLRTTVKDDLYAGIGGWASSAPNSMIFITGGYQTLDFNSVQASLSGWLGQSYLAGMLNGKYRLRTHVPSEFEFIGVLSRTHYHNQQKFFYEGDDSPSIIGHENFFRVGWSVAAGRSAKASIWGGYGYLYDHYYSSTESEYLLNGRDKSQYREWAVLAEYEYFTLDNRMFPGSGRQFRIGVSAAAVNSRFIPHGIPAGIKFINHPELTLEMLWRKYFPVTSNFNIGTLFNGVATIGRLYQNYLGTKIHAPAFQPVTSMVSVFNPDYSSRNYTAIGIMPVWNPFAKLQIRGDFYVFSPMRDLHKGETPSSTAYYEGWFGHPHFIGEATAVYNFPFASLAAYANYMSAPSSRWNFGISFGLLFEAPKFLY